MPRRCFSGVQFFEVGASSGSRRVARVLLQESLIRCLGRRVVVQIVKVNISLGEQCVGAITAAGIFTAEKFVLSDGIVEGFFIFENAALIGKQLGDGEDAGVGLGRGRIVVIDGAIDFEDALVVSPGALIFGAGFERLAGALRLGVRRFDGLMGRRRRGEGCDGENGGQSNGQMGL